MLKIVCFVLISLFSIALFASDKQSVINEVVIIPALHGLHKDHRVYDYDVLYKLVDSYNPDFVGVEIRPEDMLADIKHLKLNYPKEMYVIAQKYGPKTFGFDWLGETIEGELIPKGYLGKMEIKVLSHAMDSDTAFLKRKPIEIESLLSEQRKILNSATPYILSDGRYEKLCRKIDILEKKWYRGTRYEKIGAFYYERDRKIGENINNWIVQHPGKRIVLIMGVDHRTFAIENIKNHFGSQVKLLPIVKL